MDIGRVLKDSWTIFTKDWGALLVAALIAFVLSIVTFGLLGPALLAGLYLMVLRRVREGRKAEIGDVFGCFDRVGAYVVAYLLFLAIALAFAVIVGSPLLLLVIHNSGARAFGWFLFALAALAAICVAVYLATVWIYWTTLMVDRRRGVLEALAESRAIVARSGFWMTLLIIVIIGVIANAATTALGAVTLGIGGVLSFFVLPWQVGGLRGDVPPGDRRRAPVALGVPRRVVGLAGRGILRRTVPGWRVPVAVRAARLRGIGRLCAALSAARAALRTITLRSARPRVAFCTLALRTAQRCRARLFAAAARRTGRMATAPAGPAVGVAAAAVPPSQTPPPWSQQAAPPQRPGEPARRAGLRTAAGGRARRPFTDSAGPAAAPGLASSLPETRETPPPVRRRVRRGGAARYTSERCALEKELSWRPPPFRFQAGHRGTAAPAGEPCPRRRPGRAGAHTDLLLRAA